MRAGMVKNCGYAMILFVRLRYSSAGLLSFAGDACCLGLAVVCLKLLVSSSWQP